MILRILKMMMKTTTRNKINWQLQVMHKLTSNWRRRQMAKMSMIRRSFGPGTQSKRLIVTSSQLKSPMIDVKSTLVN